MAKAGNPTVEAVSAYYAAVRWPSAVGDVITKECVDCANKIINTP